ncbi:MAG: CvpA family protein [Planctomycetaceae bacterium]
MWYDLVCLVILGLSAWRGVVKGFIWQLASIAGILLCFVFAESFSLIAAPLTGLEPPLSRWVSILVLYILGSFGAFAFAKIVQAGLEKIKFQDYDRHLGAMFGLAKGACLCLVLSFFMFTLSPGTRDTVVLSNAGYASAVLFHQIDPVMPAGLHDILAPYVVGFDPDNIAQQRQHQVPIHTVSHSERETGAIGDTTGVAVTGIPKSGYDQATSRGVQFGIAANSLYHPGTDSPRGSPGVTGKTRERLAGHYSAGGRSVEGREARKCVDSLPRGRNGNSSVRGY